MDDRDQIFRERLIAVMSALNSGEGRDPAVRKIVGAYAYRMTMEAGARNWGDLKARANAVTYDSMLRIFQEQSAALQAKGDSKGVRGMEALALSLVARHQEQPHLVPGVNFLDRFIDECALQVSRGPMVSGSPPAPRMGQGH